ncbi:hypothetical protein AB0952_08695 [Streptomyces caniferus]|uniref:hypothetical protein n=1 Tax=Streptomyces caniferus TaxID=285557 RepID=UPI0034562C0B
MPATSRAVSSAELDAATPQDAANARIARAAGLQIISIDIRYIRARVGRWTYDGKITETEGELATFSYTDRRGRPRTATRFTPHD